MRNKIRILLLFAFCFTIVACNQSESIPTRTPVLTDPTPTIEAVEVAPESVQVLEYSLGRGRYRNTEFTRSTI